MHDVATDPPPSPTVDAAFAILRLEGMLARRLDATLGGLHGLSAVELKLLGHLGAAPAGELRRVDLASRLGMSQSSVTRLLGPLERRGLVERGARTTDGRVSPVRITRAGQSLFSEALHSAGHVADAAFDGWSEQDVRGLTSQLARLIAGLPS